MPRGKLAKKKAKYIPGPRTKRGELSPYGLRYIGRKGKPTDFATPIQCDYMVGGKRVFVKRKRKQAPFDIYLVPLIVGGRRCQNEALTSTKTKKRCLRHGPMDYDPANGDD